MGKNINILFLGGAKRTSLAERFIIAGSKLGYNVSIFSYELQSDVPIAEIAKIIVGISWKDDNACSHLQKVINDNNINIVIPFVDNGISFLADFKYRNLSSAFIPISEKEICDIMYDKVDANKWFIEHSVPVPEQEICFPLIAKPRFGSASKGIIKIFDENEYYQFILKNNINNFLVQRLIEAEEYTVDCYVSAIKKSVIGVVPRKRIEVVGGEVTKAITCKDEQMINLTHKILNSGEFYGPITIQFLKEKSTEKIYVMEINPRFGGGVLNSIEAGFDIPLILLQEFLGIEIDPLLNWRQNLLMMRTNREIFLCK